MKGTALEDKIALEELKFMHLQLESTVTVAGHDEL